MEWVRRGHFRLFVGEWVRRCFKPSGSSWSWWFNYAKSKLLKLWYTEYPRFYNWSKRFRMLTDISVLLSRTWRIAQEKLHGWSIKTVYNWVLSCSNLWCENIKLKSVVMLLEHHDFIRYTLDLLSQIAIFNAYLYIAETLEMIAGARRSEAMINVRKAKENNYVWYPFTMSASRKGTHSCFGSRVKYVQRCHRD